jgi:hypothetical protein
MNEMTSDFLSKKVLESGLLNGKPDKSYIEPFMKLKMQTKKPEDITFSDIVDYAQTNIKNGLKNASFHRRAVVTIVEIVKENDPDNAIKLKGALPLKLQKAMFN